MHITDRITQDTCGLWDKSSEIEIAQSGTQLKCIKVKTTIDQHTNLEATISDKFRGRTIRNNSEGV